MSFGVQASGRFGRPHHLRWIALALPVATVLFIAFYLLRLTAAHQQLRADTLAQAGRHAMQLAAVQAGQIEALLSGVDGMLRQYRDQAALHQPEALQNTARSAFAALPVGSLRQLAILDNLGQPLALRPGDVTSVARSSGGAPPTRPQGLTFRMTCWALITPSGHHRIPAGWCI
jgi:hypothetical protein